MIRRFLGLLAFVCAGLALDAPALASPAPCTGKFVNPITDVCWSCLFPLSVGGMTIWPSSRPDTNNPASPLALSSAPLWI